MQGYAHRGFSDFVLALGYLGDQVRERMLATTKDEAWTVEFADTGDDTNTGGRIFAVRDRVAGDVFFATYGDGVADVDLNRLLEFHRGHGKVATVTVVRPRLQFGLVQLADGGKVSGFDEKPLLDSWGNGGFFVFDRHDVVRQFPASKK